MTPQLAWQLLSRGLSASTARYALIDCAATSDFSGDDEIHTRLSRPDVEKHSLFTGQNAWAIDQVAPYLVRLDDQPLLQTWILEKGWGRIWAIFFASDAPVQTLLAHFQKLFDIQAENGRKVFFRFYDPQILRQFIPLLDPSEARAFFGPVTRFVAEDDERRPLVFDRPEEPEPSDLDPVKVITSKRAFLSRQWNRQLTQQHIDTYRGLGLEAEADPCADGLTLTDKAGTRVRLDKTASGVGVTTAEGRLFQYELTTCKHPARVLDPSGHAIHFDIQERQDRVEPEPGENLLYAIRMENGKKTYVFEYDDMNHLRRIDFPDGTHQELDHDSYGNLRDFADRNGHTTRFERDENRRLMGLTDANGHKTEFTYGDLTAPTRITFADGSALDFEYSADGLLEKLMAAGEKAASYRVDKETGTIQVDYADGTWSEFEIQDDRIIRAANPAGTVELSYDDQGRLIKETFAGRTVTYHRNATGQLTGITTPFGQHLRYIRDGENRVSAIRAWSGEKIGIHYGESGALESIAYPNGTRLSQQSTATGLPARLCLTGPGQADPIFCRTCMRDPLGRVVQIHDGDKQVDYRYDREGRLLQARSTDPLLDEFFTLDAKANRLADKAGAYTISPADRIAWAGDSLFSHDALGNLTRGRASYTWSALNRLQSVPDAGARYRYDAFGRRVEKIVAGIRTRFIWAVGQLLHEIRFDETDPLERTLQGCVVDDPDRYGDTEVIDYLFFPETPVLLAMRQEGQKTLWAAFGHRYEVLCLTDQDGRPAWQAEYDAFGRAHIQKGHRLFQPLRLCGQYYDPETGLHYNQARYYDPSLGRYLSLDPLFLESGSPNFYAYCDGDPVNRIDPSGEFIFCAMLIGAAFGAAIGAGLEAWQQHSDGSGMDGFKIARAALLGGAIGAVGGGVGAAVEGAVAAGTASTALASGTLAGMGATGFLSGTAGSVAEQCAEAVAAGNAASPLQIAKQAITDGVIGAGVGLATLGVGGFAAKRLRKAASALRPKEPGQRAISLMAKARDKNRNLATRIKRSAARKNGRSREFCVSDPVDPVTGQVVLDQEDFTLAGRIPLTWSRHYGSGSDVDGLLGRGWQCPADARLVVDPEGFVTFCDGTPKAAVFEALPEEQPVMEAADGALLEKEADGFRVRLKSGLAFHFGPQFTAAGSPVLQISDPDGHFLRFERKEGCLVRICDDSGQILEVTCDKNRISAITHHDRPLARYDYHDGLLTCAMDALGHARRFEYQNGRLVRHMDKNKVSFHYGYDTAGRCTHVWDDHGLYDYYLEYHPLQLRTRAIDSRGRVQAFVYDKDKLPIQVIDYDGAVTAYAYDDVGRVIQVTDPLGRGTRYEYDAAGNLTEIIRPDNHRLFVNYDDNHRPIQVQDPNGKIWEQRFDAKGRLAEKIDPLDGRTVYTYNAAGDLESYRDKEGHVTRFEWDTRGLLSTVTDPAGHSTHYQRDPWGGVTAVVDAAGGTMRYVHDEKGRLLQAQNPSGAGRSYAWDPEDNLVAQTDELGHQTRFEYSGFNQLAKRINADGTFVVYHYDSEENLVGVTNEKGRTYRFDYDAAGRMTRRIDYYGHSTHYTYDSAGQLIRSRDPLGRVITYAYDPAGRLRSKAFENDEREVLNWDASGNLIGFIGPGGDIQRFFDAAGNLIGEQGNGFGVEYQYDRSGRCVQRTTSNGNRVQYGYDPLGAVSHITINDQPPVAIHHDPLGRIVREQFSKYLQRTFDYDENGLLTGQRITGDSGRILRGYTYDAAGHLIEKSDSHKGPWRLDYDPLGRIIQSRDPEQRVRQYSYDPAGDLLEHLPDTSQNLRTAHFNGIEHKYDAAGNLVQRRQGVAQSRLDWDAQNRLTCVRTPDDRTIRMTYDALGRRRIKAVDGERTFFDWDGDALISERFEDQPAREYVYYPGTFEPLAVIDGDGQVYYYHNDVNGLPQELTRPNGDIVWSAAYDALGRLEKLLVDDVAQPLRFQGQYFDEETRLCYNRHRYFDPATCSFISQDPIGLAGGENVYAYAPNVWGWVDPLGLCNKTAPEKIPGIKVLRKDIDPFGEDKYGHWWVEIDGNESYGWWPKEPVDLKGTLLGVEGELNGQTHFGGSKTRDPHHGDRSAGVNVFDVYSSQSKDDTVEAIRNFSNSYSGKWSWPTGQNCHSFQKKMLKDLGLSIK
jgi:RHS repeat-associated protein